MRVLAACYGVLLGLLALALLCVYSAHAHGPAEWIERGGYKNADGQRCCGVVDCVELTDAQVRPVRGGYLILETSEFVPNGEATPGEAQTYFVCRWGGQRKCFFFPAGGV